MPAVPKKFSNLESRLPKLQKVLCESLQSDFLEIRKINKSCEKFQQLAEKIPEIKEAVYVIYSKYMKREDHENETFVFIGKTGETLCHVSGRDIALYGMLEGCGFEMSEEYACSWHEEKHGL